MANILDQIANKRSVGGVIPGIAAERERNKTAQERLNMAREELARKAQEAEQNKALGALAGEQGPQAAADAALGEGRIDMATKFQNFAGKADARALAKMERFNEAVGVVAIRSGGDPEKLETGKQSLVNEFGEDSALATAISELKVENLEAEITEAMSLQQALNQKKGKEGKKLRPTLGQLSENEETTQARETVRTLIERFQRDSPGASNQEAIESLSESDGLFSAKNPLFVAALKKSQNRLIGVADPGQKTFGAFLLEEPEIVPEPEPAPQGPGLLSRGVSAVKNLFSDPQASATPAPAAPQAAQPSPAPTAPPSQAAPSPPLQGAAPVPLGEGNRVLFDTLIVGQVYNVPEIGPQKWTGTGFVPVTNAGN